MIIHFFKETKIVNKKQPTNFSEIQKNFKVSRSHWKKLEKKLKIIVLMEKMYICKGKISEK